MGQTLTHGIYLPDEGERNCYNGLAANWSILDGAVGTVAEHTSQIAGKAPAVHTHTKSDITDFPALANVATSGSYNDLSNIPASFTPASHTHGNITNDGKVGTTANLPLITGTDGVVQAGAFGNQANTFCEGNDSRLSDARTPVAHTHTKSEVTDLLNSNFIPSANNSYDLGSASKQWLNTYSKGYYYNGVAWGLDKNNTWTSEQIFSAGTYGQMIWLKNTDLDLSVNGNTGLSDTYQHMIHWVDKNYTVYSSIQSWTASSENTLVLRSKYRTDANTVCDLSVRFTSTATNKVVYPETNADTELGISTNKWKTLNGINPGALSLPDKPGGSGTVNVNYFDLSGNVTVKDGSTYNSYTALCDGWIVIGSFASEISIEDDTTNLATTAVPKSNGYAQAYLPVRQGDAVRITINQTNTQYQNFKLIPCQGNV